MGNSPSSPPEDAPRVVIVGGGYGGITAAMKLLNKVHLTVIDERDCLHHNVAAVRACVVPGTCVYIAHVFHCWDRPS